MLGRRKEGILAGRTHNTGTWRAQSRTPQGTVRADYAFQESPGSIQCEPIAPPNMALSAHSEEIMETEENQEAASLVSQELPRVVMGEREAVAEAPRQRVIPGRVSLTRFGWIMSTLILSSGLLTGWFAWSGEEWSFWMVVLVWCLMWLWNWLYMEAWTYQRKMLKYLSAISFILMSAVMAWMCRDRAEAQEIWRTKELIKRAWQPELDLAAALLIVASCIVLGHLVWFGRGWRVKLRRPSSEPKPETSAQQDA